MAKDDFTAFMGPGTEYEGRLNFKGTVRIDCRFTGDISSDGKLILGKDAKVDGTIKVADLVAHGAFSGTAMVIRRTILHQGAFITGTLTTQTLVMEEGASMQGELHMGKDAAKTTPLAQHLSAKAEPGVQVIDAAVKQ